MPGAPPRCARTRRRAGRRRCAVAARHWSRFRPRSLRDQRPVCLRVAHEPDGVRVDGAVQLRRVAGRGFGHDRPLRARPARSPRGPRRHGSPQSRAAVALLIGRHTGGVAAARVVRGVAVASAVRQRCGSADRRPPDVPGSARCSPTISECACWSASIPSTCWRSGPAAPPPATAPSSSSPARRASARRSCCAPSSSGPGRNRCWGMCDSLSTPRPLGPLRDVADELGPSVPALLRGTAAAQHEIFAAVLDALRSRPRVFVVEDLHWADEATLDLVRFLARGSRGCPCCWCCPIATRWGRPSPEPGPRRPGRLAGRVRCS